MFPLVDFENNIVLSKTPMHKVWSGMEDLVKKGLTKSIGVSNCTMTLLFDILTYCDIKPATN